MEAVRVCKTVKVEMFGNVKLVFVLAKRVNGNGVTQYQVSGLFRRGKSMWIDADSLQEKMIRAKKRIS